MQHPERETTDALGEELARLRRENDDLKTVLREHESNFTVLGDELTVLRSADDDRLRLRKILSLIRDRVDADVCFLVARIGTAQVGRVAAGSAVGRDGWTNQEDWQVPSALADQFNARFLPGTIISFSDADIKAFRGVLGAGEADAVLWQFKRFFLVHVRRQDNSLSLICIGFAEEHALSEIQRAFIERSAYSLESFLERIESCEALERARTLAQFRSDVVEFMFRHPGYSEVEGYINDQMLKITGAQHVVLYRSDGTRQDRFAPNAPKRCHVCAERDRMWVLTDDVINGPEEVIIASPAERGDVKLPPGCPSHSSVRRQIRRGDGEWWCLIADYTMPHAHDLHEVGRTLHMSLELLVMAYEREQMRKGVPSSRRSFLYAHEQLCAEGLLYIMDHNELSGLMTLFARHLSRFIGCDKVCLHRPDGVHETYRPDGTRCELSDRCPTCPYYTKALHYDEEGFLVVEDMERNAPAPVPAGCPVKSLISYRIVAGGKLWGYLTILFERNPFTMSRMGRLILKTAAELLVRGQKRLQDLRDQRVLLERLKDERDRAIAARKAKGEFFSVVSHEIRTPLNSVIGFSEILQMGGADLVEQQRYLGAIATCGRNLLTSMDDIIDISQLDAKQMEIHPRPTDVANLVERVFASVEAKAYEKGLVLMRSFGKLPLLELDPQRLRQVVLNLVDNAVKYTARGVVEVTASWTDAGLKSDGKGRRRGKFVLAVRDTGCGIPADQLEKLTVAYVQLGNADRRGGAGLGLAVCDRLARRTGGSLAIASEVGKGSTFTFTIPRVRAVPAEERPAPEPPAVHPASTQGALAPNAVRILLVDDSPLNLVVLKTMLTRLGVKDLTLAHDGREALQILEEQAPFNLVLTDYRMPELDGAGLIAAIRASGRLAKLPVYVVTADVDVQKVYAEQGFTDILLKPVSLAKLREVLAREQIVLSGS